jgi:hypothetical protein
MRTWTKRFAVVSIGMATSSIVLMFVTSSSRSHGGDVAAIVALGTCGLAVIALLIALPAVLVSAIGLFVVRFRQSARVALIAVIAVAMSLAAVQVTGRDLLHRLNRLWNDSGFPVSAGRLASSHLIAFSSGPSTRFSESMIEIENHGQILPPAFIEELIGTPILCRRIEAKWKLDVSNELLTLSDIQIDAENTNTTAKILIRPAGPFRVDVDRHQYEVEQNDRP